MSARRAFSIVTVAATVPAALVAQLFACGPSGNKQVDSGIHLIDSSGGSGGSGTDAAASPCTATASYGTPDFGSNQGATDHPATGSGSSATPHEITYSGALNADASPDVLFLDLYQGYGGFGSGDIVPGTYQISGAETSYSTCGICALILTDLHMSGSAVAETDDYMATGGSVTLTSLSGSNFAGSVSNLTFTHVMIGSDGTTTAVGDCNSSITSATMNAALTQGSAAFTGGKGIDWGNLEIHVLAHRYR